MQANVVWIMTKNVLLIIYLCLVVSIVVPLNAAELKATSAVMLKILTVLIRSTSNLRKNSFKYDWLGYPAKLLDQVKQPPAVSSRTSSSKKPTLMLDAYSFGNEGHRQAGRTHQAIKAIKLRPPGIKKGLDFVRDGIQRRRRRFVRSTNLHKRMNWTDFQRFDVIEAWLDKVAASRPFTKAITIGKTWEKRNIKLIEINTNNAKDIFWIDGGIHAREWASPATVTYFIHELVNNYESNKELVDSFRWYILPVHNPDGYEYSHTKIRMWRKNRSQRRHGRKARSHSRSSGCVGVDLNRNWNFHWGVGGSSHPCAETYKGTTPDSEESIVAVKNFIRNLSQTVQGSRLAAFYTIHSYGPAWLTPWGWTTEDAPNNARLVEVAKAGVNAIKKRYGTHYKLMKSYYLGVAAGASDDWAYGVAKFAFSYTLELPGKGFGFRLPKAYIKEVATETFDGLKASAMKIKEILN